MPTHPSHHDSGNGPAGTTRTRLPEGGYATPRRPPARMSRTLVTVVGIVVLLIAVLAFATRGSSGGTAAGATGSGPGSPAGTAPTAAPTTPTGTRPVTTTTSGIPTGYPHTPQGAQSAAANYAVALGGTGMFTTATRHRIVAATYAPSVVASTQQELDKAYTGSMLSALGLGADGTTPSGLVFVSRTVPVGTKIADAGSGDTTTVQVWCTSLSGLAGSGSTKPVSETWLTITEHLEWVGKDWKIAASSQSQGPAPISSDQQAATADQIAGAVNGYGGFTYAR